MAYQKLTIVPGSDIEKTLSDNESTIHDNSFIRWRDRTPEKRGGWLKWINAAFSGYIRELLAWQGLNNDQRLGIGSTTNLYVVSGTNITDITPITATANIAPDLSVNIFTGPYYVTVVDTGRNATIYDVVVFNTQASVGGIFLYGAYQIKSVVDANTYVITAATSTGTTVNHGGTVATFTTTTGANAVTVNIAGHPYQVGDEVAFPVSTTGNGVTIYGQYLVQSITTNTYVINANTQASSAGTFSMNGGNLSLTYYITQGPTTAGLGFGAGGFGSGGYGTGSPAPSGGTGSKVVSTDWWLSNWGEILIACPPNGPLYTWTIETGNSNASIVQQAPLQNQGAFLAMPQQQVMLWGSTYNGLSDPLQIRWSDAGNYTVWFPSAINQAGGFRIPTGSKIVRGMQGPTQTFWFTDIDLYVAQYIGTPYIWGFNKVATGCGLIAPKAAVGHNAQIFWMSQKQFFATTGSGVDPIPCPVWDFVFQNLNSSYVNNIRAASNSQFNEVSWFFPSSASTTGENDSYVTYNTLYNEWDFGPINRSAWIDQSVLGSPIGSDSNGYVYQHEVSPDADGAPITAYFKTGYFSVSDGNDFVFIDHVIPDMVWNTYTGSSSAVLQVSFNVADYPGDTPVTYGPFTISQAVQYIEPRFRGRYVQIVVQSSDLGSFWRLGSFRVRMAQDGKL